MRNKINNNSLNLSIRKARKYIHVLSNIISDKYGVSVTNHFNEPVGHGYIKDGVDGDFSISVGAKMKTNGFIFNKKVDDIDFLKCICSIYHEQHHIVQNCDMYYSNYPSEDIIAMSMRKLASSENRRYYKWKNRYCNDLSEIDAESFAVLNTYNFMKDNFPKADADTLICKLVNHKIQISDYFIFGEFTTLDDILNAFSDKYENVKYTKVDYSVYPLHQSENINKNEDECIKFMQFCIKESECNQPLIDKFNNTTNPYEKDMLISSITHYLHPEIDYERVYPCLRNIDLSPEEVFGRNLDVSDMFVGQISKKKS